MIRETLLEFASQSPEFGQGIDVIEERLSNVCGDGTSRNSRWTDR